jgi:hypothetical protein
MDGTIIRSSYWPPAANGAQIGAAASLSTPNGVGHLDGERRMRNPSPALGEPTTRFAIAQLYTLSKWGRSRFQAQTVFYSRPMIRCVLNTCV